MSERKVLNKYYPPDFDPSKIPRVKLPKNRQYIVRLMAPFNMRCKTCGEYIYKGKKFNARKEDVEGEDYCGIRIYRFYIKCTRCLQEISFRTDPRNTDYEIEAGATRNFMAVKLAEEEEKRKEQELKEEEANNPMKLLENRTEQSRLEMELIESLEELKELNRRHYNIDFDALLAKYNTREVKEKLQQLQQEKDEEIVKAMFNNKRIKIEEEIVENLDNSTQQLEAVSEFHSTLALDGSAAPGFSLEQDEDQLQSSSTQNKLTNDLQAQKEPDTRPCTSSASEKQIPDISDSLPKVEGKFSLSGVSNNLSSKSLHKKIRSFIQKKETPKQENALSLIGAYSGSDDSN